MILLFLKNADIGLRRASTHACATRAILANMNKEQPDDFAKEQFDQLTAYRERLRTWTTPEVINHSVEEAIQNLKEIFGVENLSNLELASLRRETIAVAEENLKMASDFDETNVLQKGKSMGMDIMGFPIYEVVERFLLSYGINAELIPEKFKTEEDKEYYFKVLRENLKFAREASHKPYLD